MREGETIVEARLEDGARATVEPGGQIEFSSAPRPTLTELERDVGSFLSRLHDIAQRRGLLFIAAGFDPIRSLDEQR
ncbi:glutamate-cysteine ligase family protein, partial [Escherichia coli]|nr:glutamate-cysteine ligase family protein [Escherichia coli]